MYRTATFPNIAYEYDKKEMRFITVRIPEVFVTVSDTQITDFGIHHERRFRYMRSLLQKFTEQCLKVRLMTFRSADFFRGG